VIQLDIEEGVRKQILLELKTLHKTQCEYVVSFFDAFYNEGSFYIALEYMNGGSLAHVLSKAGSIPENVLGKIAIQVQLSLEVNNYWEGVKWVELLAQEAPLGAQRHKTLQFVD
jgi:serine/threonine protein kinase